MQFKTLIALVFGLGALTSLQSQGSTAVRAEQVQPPLQVRFNTDLWKRVFKIRDQEILSLFSDMEVEGQSSLSNVVASILPTNVSTDDYDFDLSLSKEFLGATGKGLEFKGSGELNGVKVSFRIPITEAKSKYVLGEKYNTQADYSAFVFNEDEWVLEVDPANAIIEGAELAADEIGKLVDDLKSSVDNLKTMT